MDLEEYKALADKLTMDAENYVWKLRNELANKARKELLIPFCKRNNLTFCSCVYSNIFYTEDGESIDSDDLIDRFPDDPDVELIEDMFRIQFYGDEVFDYGMALDIVTAPLHSDV